MRAASGRQRFNVLGACRAVTRELIAVTNTTVVNTKTTGELLRAVATGGLVGPITFVLDIAHYQRNATEWALAAQLGITLLHLLPARRAFALPGHATARQDQVNCRGACRWRR